MNSVQRRIALSAVEDAIEVWRMLGHSPRFYSKIRDAVEKISEKSELDPGIAARLKCISSLSSLYALREELIHTQIQEGAVK